MTRRRRHLAHSQRGMTLPLTLGILMVLGIVAATVAAVGLTGQDAQRRMTGEQKAFSLAEAGLEQAVAYLYRSNDPAVVSAVPAGSQLENGGTMAWSGSLSGNLWTLTGTGTAPAQNGAGLVTRTVTAQYRVSVQGTIWEYTFGDATSGCMTISNNAEFSAPLYLRGNLCLSNNQSRFTGSKLHVEGTLTTNNGRVGQSAAQPIDTANIVGGCTGGSPSPHTCTSSDRVYATTNTQTPGTLSKPTVDLDYWYTNAAPGPSQDCTQGTMPGGFDTDTTRNSSRPAFDLTPGFAYDCRVTDGASNIIGRLTWTPGSPGTLQVEGTSYFDGNLYTSGTALYTGRGTIYASGTVTFSNNATICGVAGCTASWNPTQNLLMLVAGSSTPGTTFLLSNGAKYQGAGYAVMDFYMSNNVENWGPVAARQITIENNAGQQIPLTTLAPGAPGIQDTIWMVAGSWRG